MPKIIKEISCITGEDNNASGERKKRYQRIGSIIETKNGPMLKMDAIPLRENGWDGWAYINDPKPRDNYQGLPRDNEDDIPF